MPAVTVSERLALSLRALGAAGDAWLAGLPGLLASMAADWSVIVGARLDGGHAAYVAEAVALDGTTVVIKAAIPPGIDGFTPFDPGRAVLVHGDVHSFNALQAPGPTGAGAGFRLVDPGGLISEPAHDLGVIQVRSVQGWIGDLAARDPREASRIVARRCERAGRLAGADPEAVWQWAFAELVSTGLFMLRLGHHQEAEAFLAVAGKLMAAIPYGQRGQARQAGQVTPERGPGRTPGRPAAWSATASAW